MPPLAHALLLALALALGPSAQRLAVPDIDGAARTPLAVAPGDTHVLFFVAVDCPISNRYAPEIRRLTAEYGPKRVRAFLIYADPSATPARVRTHLSEFHAGLEGVPAIIDTAFAVTSAVRATVTPESAVYTAAGRVYRGRIDDLYVSLGQARRQPTRQDLRLSLDAVLEGLTVPAAETKAVGCYIQR